MFYNYIKTQQWKIVKGTLNFSRFFRIYSTHSSVISVVWGAPQAVKNSRTSSGYSLDGAQVPGMVPTSRLFMNTCLITKVINNKLVWVPWLLQVIALFYEITSFGELPGSGWFPGNKISSRFFFIAQQSSSKIWERLLLWFRHYCKNSKQKLYSKFECPPGGTLGNRGSDISTVWQTS